MKMLPHHKSPQKLLEITIISATDLPAVSKTLRAYVAAWVDSGEKLTTRINRDGHTNPTWNYRLVFSLEGNDDVGAVEFEIYNVAWLRDIPIGTATLALNSFLPPLASAKEPALRHAALPIRRPTGEAQGTLNVTVQLIDKSPPETDVDSEFSASPVSNSGGSSEEDGGEEDEGETQGENRENNIDGEDQPEPEIKRTKSVRIVSDKEDATSTNDDEARLKHSTSFASYVSGMHPLPSEVASDLKKHLCYFSGDEDEYGSSIFENWSIPDHININISNNEEFNSKGSSSKSVTWKTENRIIPFDGDNGGTKKPPKDRRRRHHRHRRSRSDGGGLLSCFGSVCGFEYSFVCGGGSHPLELNKKKKKKKVSF